MDKKELPLELIYDQGFLDNGFRLEYPEGTIVTAVGLDPLYTLIHHFRSLGIELDDVEFFIRIPND